MSELTSITFDIWEVILIGIVVAFVIYGITKIFVTWQYKRESQRKRAYYLAKEQDSLKEPPKDKTIQRLEDMCKGTIESKKLMNEEESKIYYCLAKVFRESHNISPQVSFKAFLKGEEGTEAWRSFSDFYCDFLITHKKGEQRNKPFAVIEYYGGGHYGNSAESKERVRKNDYIKKQVLDSAGIEYIIIQEKDIKTDSKYIDDKELEAFIIELYALYVS